MSEVFCCQRYNNGNVIEICNLRRDHLGRHGQPWSEREAVVAYLLLRGESSRLMVRDVIDSVARGDHLTAAREGRLDAFRERARELMREWQGMPTTHGVERAIQAAILDEREACARECDKIGESTLGNVAHRCAARIRARGDGNG